MDEKETNTYGCERWLEEQLQVRQTGIQCVIWVG